MRLLLWLPAVLAYSGSGKIGIGDAVSTSTTALPIPSMAEDYMRWLRKVVFMTPHVPAKISAGSEKANCSSQTIGCPMRPCPYSKPNFTFQTGSNPVNEADSRCSQLHTSHYHGCTVIIYGPRNSHTICSSHDPQAMSFHLNTSEQATVSLLNGASKWKDYFIDMGETIVVIRWITNDEGNVSVSVQDDRTSMADAQWMMFPGLNGTANFRIKINVTGGVLSNFTFFYTVLTLREMHLILYGVEPQLRVRPECGCPRTHPSEWGEPVADNRWSRQSDDDFVYCYNGWSAPVPRTDSFGLYSLVAKKPFASDFWMSAQTDTLNLILDFNQPMIIYGINTTFLRAPPLKMEVSSALTGNATFETIAYVANSCYNSYNMTAYQFSSSPTQNLTMIPFSAKCYQWQDFMSSSPMQQYVRVANQSYNLSSFVLPLYTPDVTPSNQVVARRLMITLNGHQDPSYSFFMAKQIKILARMSCNDASPADSVIDIDSMKSYAQIMNSEEPQLKCSSQQEATDCSFDLAPIWTSAPEVCRLCACSNLSRSSQCDKQTGQCPCSDDGGDPAKAGKQCYWYIEGVRPAFGPIAGGTTITVTGGYMHNLNISRIEPNLSSFTIQRRNLTVVEIRTPSYPYENSMVNLTLRAELFGVQSYIGDDINFGFQYRPNPVLESITPRRSILSGGLLLTVTGKYLDSVDKPMMLIHFCNSSDIIVISVATICEVKNPGMMLCPTPNLRTMYINIVQLGKPASMFFGLSGKARKAIAATPAASNTLPARSRRSIANQVNPLLDQPNDFVYKKEISPVADRLKRQASSGERRSLDEIYGYTFSFGFVFDGLEDYVDLRKSNDTTLQALSKIFLYLDPDVTHFAEDGRVKVFQPEDLIIEIDGTTMNSGCDISDYRVTVGLDGVCNITSLSTNKLKCRPPTEQPSTDASHYKTYNGKEVPHVEVKLGNRNWSAGYLFYKTSPWDDPKVRAGIIAMIVCLIVIAFVVGGVWLVRRRMRKNARRRNLNTDSLHDDPRYQPGPGSSTTKPFLYDKISPDLVSKINKCKISSANLSVGNMVGKGNFGKVFRGQFKKDDTDQLITVAVKALRDGVMSLTDLENFLNEATIMIDFQHPNVLTLIGVVWEKNDPPLVVLPYMDHGDLKSLLKKEDLTFQLGDLLHFGLQIARGMEYLAHHRFVHRDLAARNCMVNSDYLVKIADFGLSVDVYDTEYYRSETKSKPLPIKWMAIESIKEGRFTTKSDVWAFGITMWEIVTRGSTPYPAVNNYDVRSHLEAGRRLDQPEYCPTVIYELMLRCWLESFLDRPTFTELAQHLSGVLTPTGGAKGEELYSRDYTNAIADDYLEPIMSEDHDVQLKNPVVGDYLIPITSTPDYSDTSL